jgi:hypothetical protein
VERPYDLEMRCYPVISYFLADRVRFLIVGGWAVRFHGYTDRKVGDLDLLVDFSAENWPSLTVALLRLNVPVRPFHELAQGPKPFQDKDSLHPADLLTAIGSAFSDSKSVRTLLPNFNRRLVVASLLNGSRLTTLGLTALTPVSVKKASVSESFRKRTWF